MNVARSHQTLGCIDERIRDGVHLPGAPMARKGLHDERTKRFVGGTGRWPREAVRGVHEFQAMEAFGHQGERPTEPRLKKAH